MRIKRTCLEFKSQMRGDKTNVFQYKKSMEKFLDQMESKLAQT